MAIQPVYDSLKLSSKKKTTAVQIKIEGKADALLESSRVLDVCVFLGCADTEISQGKVRFLGTAIFSVLYQAEDGLLKKYEYAVPYSGDIEDAFISPNCRVIISSHVEKTGSLKDDKFIFFAYATFTAQIVLQEPISYLSGGENILVDQKEEEYYLSYGLKRLEYPIEEQFELNYPVLEVLSQNVNTAISTVTSGVGCIIIDGELCVSSLLLQNNEKRDIIKEERSFPFRAEIEYDEAMPAMKACAKMQVKSFKADIVVDSESNKSTVTYTVNTLVFVEAFSLEKATFINDAFSVGENLNVVFAQSNLLSPCQINNYTKRICGRISVQDIPAGSRITAVNKESSEITHCEITDNGLLVRGVLSLTALFSDGEENNFSLNMEAPFEEVLDCTYPQDAIVEVLSVAKHGGARIISFSEAEICADVCLSVYADLQSNIKYVREISSLGEKVQETCAVSVFIGMVGEDLWSLSKRLNVAPNTLCETNKDLQFPLTGKERILVYRRK